MTDSSKTPVVIRKHRRSTQLRLVVRDDGSIRLTIPQRVSFAVAKKFLLEKEEWIAQARRLTLARPPRLLNQGGAEEYRTHKESARQLITERVLFFQKHYGVTHTALSIRNQRSRFGSCSARGQLSFNYRLIFLPRVLFDYVIVHEICHLRELNHSSRFWTLVAETLPLYREHRRALQTFFRSTS